MTDYKSCIESLKPKYDKCPTCGSNTRILSDEEGTSCYEAVNIEALRQIIHEKDLIIDTIRTENKELREAVGKVLPEVEFASWNLDNWWSECPVCRVSDLDSHKEDCGILKLKQAYEKGDR